MEVHYSIETEILIISRPQGCPACMSHKTYTVHDARQTSRSLLWPDRASGVHHTIKHASRDAEGTAKVSERCQSEEASPATVINSAPSACVLQTPRKGSRQASYRSCTRTRLCTTLCCTPAARRRRFAYAPLPWSIDGACFQKRAWGLFLGWEKAQQRATFAVWIHQPEELGFCSPAHTHRKATVRSNPDLAHFCCVVFPWQKR